MEIKEGKKYICKESFEFQGIEISKGNVIGVNVIQEPMVYCDAYCQENEYMKRFAWLEINSFRLERYLNIESETDDFDECEECHRMLDSLPSGAWGVGYVCASCAKELRGEFE